MSDLSSRSVLINLPVVPETLAVRLSAEIPSQRSFVWNRIPWMKVGKDVPEISKSLHSLPDALNRESTRETVQINLQNGQVLAAFVPVLIWGGPGGYGPFRARSILTGVRNRSNAEAPIDPLVQFKLREAAATVRTAGPEEAFRLMNNEGKVKYLGGAFFTKWLSFASMVDSTDGPMVAPILDKRVRDWIAQNTAQNQTIELSTTSTADYRRYLELLDAWGGPFGRTRVQVEQSIFDLTRDRPPAD